ncbi:MAG TPA: hypothetical protein VF541_03665 [Longimicrobium sp.]
MIRFRAESGEVLLTTDTIDELIESAPIPKTLVDGLENLLVYIGDRQNGFSRFVQLPDHRFPVTVAACAEDFTYLKVLLQTVGYAESFSGVVENKPQALRLSLNGWKRMEELRATRPDSRRAFVAMSFDRDLKAAWLEGIKPALEELGFTPIRLDYEQFNEPVDDRIVADIRRSGLVVADYTGNSAGVYFEAGFAMGLGIPVISTCRSDAVAQVHFDTRQYNHVVWDTPADLRERLSARIEATLPAARPVL